MTIEPAMLYAFGTSNPLAGVAYPLEERWAAAQVYLVHGPSQKRSATKCQSSMCHFILTVVTHPPE